MSFDEDGCCDSMKLIVMHTCDHYTDGGDWIELCLCQCKGCQTGWVTSRHAATFEVSSREEIKFGSGVELIMKLLQLNNQELAALKPFFSEEDSSTCSVEILDFAICEDRKWERELFYCQMEGYESTVPRTPSGLDIEKQCMALGDPLDTSPMTLREILIND